MGRVFPQMGEAAKQYRSRAQDCRDMAKNVDDEAWREALMDMARDFDEEARRLEAQQPGPLND